MLDTSFTKTNTHLLVIIFFVKLWWNYAVSDAHVNFETIFGQHDHVKKEPAFRSRTCILRYRTCIRCGIANHFVSRRVERIASHVQPCWHTREPLASAALVAFRRRAVPRSRPTSRLTHFWRAISFQDFRRIVLGSIEASDSESRVIFQHFSKSTPLANWIFANICSYTVFVYFWFGILHNLSNHWTTSQEFSAVSLFSLISKHNFGKSHWSFTEFQIIPGNSELTHFLLDSGEAL